jgi:hypothetical protein
MIDTEGFDFEVIKMFNISESKPGLIIFESSHLSEEDIAEADQLFSDNDYDVRKDGANTVAMKKSLNQNYTYFN